MTEQLGLFDGPGILTRQWTRFHRENPKVWELFNRFASEALYRGRQRLGARAVWERMRWYTTIETDDFPVDWKLNDHYPPFYARLFMAAHDCDGFFSVRDSEADDVNYHLILAEMRKGTR